MFPCCFGAKKDRETRFSVLVMQKMEREPTLLFYSPHFSCDLWLLFAPIWPGITSQPNNVVKPWKEGQNHHFSFKTCFKSNSKFHSLDALYIITPCFWRVMSSCCPWWNQGSLGWLSLNSHKWANLVPRASITFVQQKGHPCYCTKGSRPLVTRLHMSLLAG